MSITVSDTGRVRTIMLDNPDKLNAWSAAMEAAFRDTVARAAEDETVRAIVVTGAGKAFCAGADLSGGAPTAPPPGPSPHDDAQRYSYLMAVPKPVIAAINGAVAGVGLCLALFCDVRFVSSHARLTTAFSRRGMIAEHGSAWLLPQLIGPMNARDLLLSGRTIDAAEADRIGLARLVPEANFASVIGAYAQDLAERCSPRSIGVIKRQLVAAMRQSLGDAVRYADIELERCRGTEDLAEGIAHFVEKRAPAFTGR